VDFQRKGRLSFNQVALVLFLLENKKRGAEVPSILPENVIRQVKV